MRPAARPDPESHERSFLARIELVRKQALRLTGDATAAEDLAQDAFVRFILAKPDLDRIANLDAYLTTMVRNIHLSRVRRAKRRPETSINLIDYDSVELAAGAIDGRSWLDARHALRQACAYGCLRRLSSKAGSIFLLRFFHGLTAGEAARVAHSSARAVDEWIRQGRGELKIYLTDPGRLRFLRDQASDVELLPPSPSGAGDSVETLVAELRAEIFARRHETCLSADAWTRLYDAEAEAIPTDRLAEIVTCPHCLDEALRRNGLPPTSGPPGETERRRSRGPRDVIDAVAQRARRVREHRPRSFCVAVNGFVVGREHIRGERSELTLSATLNEPIAFVEIWSEQDVCLLSQVVEPPPAGDAIQSSAVALSDGRSVTVEISFGDHWPEIRAAYLDPHAAVAVTPPAAEPSREILSTPLGHGLRHRWPAFDFSFWRMTQLGAGLAAFLLIAWIAADRWQPAVSASELLHRADAAQRAFASAPGLIVHRVVRLEMRAGQSPVRSRQRIETWHNGNASGLHASRVYDEADQLIGGEWSRPDGRRVVYRRGAAPREEASSDPRRPSTAEIWRWDLSPSAFVQLAGSEDRVTMRRTDGHVAFETAPASGDIASARLTVTADGLHPVSQTLVARVGNGLVEYRFEEQLVERLPAADVPRERFEPDPALLEVPASAPERTAPAAAPHVAAAIDAVAIDRWELTATWRLHRLSPCLAMPARLERRRDRGMTVSVVAAGERCRTEIVTALGDLRGQGGITVDVRAAAEQGHVETPPEAPPIGDDELRRVPAYAPLFEYYARAAARSRSGTSDVDAALGSWIRQLVVWGRDRSSRIRRRAEALRTLNQRWTTASLAALDLDARNMWQQLVREQTRALGEDVRMLRLQLEPALFAGAPEAAADAPLTGLADVGPALDRLSDFAERADQLVQAALRSYPATDPVPPVDGAAIGRSLKALERYAAIFDDPWTLEP